MAAWDASSYDMGYDFSSGLPLPSPSLQYLNAFGGPPLSTLLFGCDAAKGYRGGIRRALQGPEQKRGPVPGAAVLLPAADAAGSAPGPLPGGVAGLPAAARLPRSPGPHLVPAAH